MWLLFWLAQLTVTFPGPGSGVAITPITFVQSVAGKNAASSTTVQTSTVTTVTGDFLVACVRQDTDGTAPSSVKQTAGATFTQYVAANSSQAGTDLMSVWYETGITGAVGDVITGTWAGNHSFKSIVVFEFNPQGNTITTDAADGFNLGSQTGPASITSRAINIAGATEVVVACSSTNSVSQTFTVGNIAGSPASFLRADAAAGSELTAGEASILVGPQSSITASINFSATGTSELSTAAFQ